MEYLSDLRISSWVPRGEDNVTYSIAIERAIQKIYSLAIGCVEPYFLPLVTADHIATKIRENSQSPSTADIAVRDGSIPYDPTMKILSLHEPVFGSENDMLLLGDLLWKQS